MDTKMDQYAIDLWYRESLGCERISYSEELKANSGDDACNGSDQHCSEWLDVHVGAGTHRNTSSQRGVLNMNLCNRIQQAKS